MKPEYINIHTHRPTGRGIELRTAGIHPWQAGREDIPRTGVTGGEVSGTRAGAISGVTGGETSVAQAGAISGMLSGDVQAIGEIGLDFACGADREAQTALFRAQLTLARKEGLPVVLHCVRAFGEVMRELAAAEPRAVIFHGFIGSPEQARRALGRGYYLSFGERTFASPKTVASLRATPLDRLFAETDDSPTPIEEIYARIAAVRGIGIEELKRATTENYERIFTHG